MRQARMWSARAKELALNTNAATVARTEYRWKGTSPLSDVPSRWEVENV